MVFENRERISARPRSRGYYREYTVPTPGEDDRGARRIVTGDEGQYYWTEDHYASFERIDRDERTRCRSGRTARRRASTAGTATSTPPTCGTPSSTPAGATATSTGWEIEHKAEFLAAVGEALSFPGHYGQNLDALADCLSDLPRRRHGAALGRLVAVRPRRAAAVLGRAEVLGTHARDERTAPFAVLLRGEGPDLPEVPSLD